MKKIYFSFFIFLTPFYGEGIEPKYLCSHEKSASRWQTQNSTLNQNQEKIDIKFYELNLDINFNSSRIRGSVTVNGVIGNIYPDFIELDFYDNMTVDSILQNNIPILYLHENDMLKIPISDITIDDENLFSLTIFYQGTPDHCGAGGFKFDEHQNIGHVWTLSEAYCARSWWPCKDDPSDKADSVNIIISVPLEPAYIVASNGLLSSTTINSNKKTYFWKERYPITTYLVSLAIYPYTKWVDQYVSPISSDTMLIEHYVFPDRYEASYPNYSLTKDMLSFFSELFGEYPFISEKYGHADFTWGGGMEHQTLSSMGSFSQNLMVHELGHSWWGNLITCKTFNDIWLNEGFARYCQALWAEHMYGREAYFDFMNNHAYYGAGTIYVENPSSNSQIFSAGLSYNKASWVLHMLRHKVGETMFFDILKTYASNDSLSYNAASTSDFQKVCEDISGLDLEQFFQQWIYGEKYPKYELSWWHEGNGIYNVKIDQVQSYNFFSMPIDLKFAGSAGPMLVDTTIVIENNNSSQLYEFSGFNFLVENVMLDPENWILKEATYSVNEIDNILPDRVEVEKAFPNPFNSKVKLSFYINPQFGDTHVNVNIFDLRGKIVESLIDNEFIPGYHTTFWNANGKSSGVYFIQLATDNYIDSQKILFLK
ncbi:T9SS type A sorting domain-containing protein [bacterium]|nr:MAG: T9SS type A sorting domain-containing protein [bacterium]